MSIVAVTLKMYGVVARAAFLACLRNPRVLLATPALFLVLGAAVWLVAPLGILGGFLFAIAQAACYSAYLVLIEEVMRPHGRATWADFKRGFSTYLWDVMGVLFIFWIGGMVMRVLIPHSSMGGTLTLVVTLAASIVFNVVPELIYQGRTRSVELLRESASFMEENWLEWLSPILFLTGVIWTGTMLEAGGGFPDPGRLATWMSLLGFMAPSSVAYTIAVGMTGAATRLTVSGLVVALVLLALFYFMMVFRGMLFAELRRGSRRQRLYRYRAER